MTPTNTNLPSHEGIRRRVKINKQGAKPKSASDFKWCLFGMVYLKSYAIAGEAGKKAMKQLLRGNFKGFSSNVDACRTLALVPGPRRPRAPKVCRLHDNFALEPRPLLGRIIYFGAKCDIQITRKPLCCAERGQRTSSASFPLLKHVNK